MSAKNTCNTYFYFLLYHLPSICLVTATDRDVDVQFLSQKEFLGTTDNAIYIKGGEYPKTKLYLSLN